MSMDADQVIVRDSIIFAVALMFVAGGLADAAHILTGLSWWGAAPLGAVLWGTAAILLYRRVQSQLADPPNETVA